jgi:hypothetical protein
MSDPRVDVALIPSTLLLLPEYAGVIDPIPDLRSTCLEVITALGQAHPNNIGVLAAPLRPDDETRGITAPAGLRIARHLLDQAGFRGDVTEPDTIDGLLVLANGSARRTDHSPGSYDERAEPFDNAIETALRSGDLAALTDLEEQLAGELLCPDVSALRRLGELATTTLGGELSRAEDPLGVRYWVGWWTCTS